MPIAISAQIDVILHATEDHARVLESFALLGLEQDFRLSSAAGHYGNDIVHASLVLRRGEADAFAERLFAVLPHTDLAGIYHTLDSRMSDSTLHIRMDKQELVLGRAAVRDGGLVRIRIRVPGHGGRGALERLLHK